jgi:peroxiredoxin Q/BCP
LDDGTAFRLSDWVGKKHVVLYFYPRDFTPGCTREARSFRDNHAAITAQGALLVCVSTDSAASHLRFRASCQLPFLLGADPEKSVTKLYGVNRPFWLAPTRRVTFLIDKAGVVRGVFHHELAIGRHQDDVLVGLRRLNAVAARHGGPPGPARGG